MKYLGYKKYFSIRISEVYKILGFISVLFFIGFFYFVSTNLPLMSRFIFEWQVEKLGLRATFFDKVSAKWGEAHFENVQLVPLHKNLKEVGKNSCPTHYISVKSVKVQYHLKDFIRFRFRHLMIEGLSASCSIHEKGSWELEIPPSETQSGNRKIKNLSQSAPKNQAIIVKNVHLIFFTPYGPVEIRGDMNIMDFLTRMVLGSGHVVVQTPIGDIEGTIKIDKVEGKLWRATIDTQGNTLLFQKAQGIDTKAHLELILNGAETCINGYLTSTDLSISLDSHPLSLQYPRADFKFSYTPNHQFKGDIIGKIISLKSDHYTAKDIDGTLACEGKNFSISQYHGEILFNQISHKDVLPFLKPFSIKSLLDYKNDTLKFESFLNVSPFVVSSKGSYDFKNLKGRGVVESSSFNFGEATDLGSVSPFLEAYLKNLKGSVSLKGEFLWSDQKAFSPSLTLKLKDLSFKEENLTVEGLKGDVSFNNFWPLTTLPHQEIKAKEVKVDSYTLKDAMAYFQVLPGDTPLHVEKFSALFQGKPLTFSDSESETFQKILKKNIFKK